MRVRPPWVRDAECYRRGDSLSGLEDAALAAT